LFKKVREQRESSHMPAGYLRRRGVAAQKDGTGNSLQCSGLVTVVVGVARGSRNRWALLEEFGGSRGILETWRDSRAVAAWRLAAKNGGQGGSVDVAVTRRQC
jgi:hypothetical protein